MADRYLMWTTSNPTGVGELSDTVAPNIDDRSRREQSTAGTPTVLPRRDYRFDGVIGRTVADSSPARFPQPVTAPRNAPNVLLILLDDVGFGQFGTFGGATPTPALHQLAAEGLRYNRFHTTAICSPTRAALLTGRKHHVAAAGGIAESATG